MARFDKRWRRVAIGLLILTGVGLLGWPHLRAWYHYRAGRSAVQRYHGEEALTHFEACLAVWPRFTGAHLLASRAARLAGDYKAAEQHLRDAQRLSEDKGPSPEIALEWALLRAAAGDLMEVEGFLQGQLKRTSEPALIEEALVEGYIRNYRILDALSVLDPWLEREPNDPQANFLKGELWRHAWSVQKAIPGYRRAVELDPERLDARRWLGLMLLETGYYAEALEHLQIARRRLPGDPQVTTALARCHASLNQNAEANALLDEVLQDHPDYGPALTERGCMLHAANNLSEAEVWLRRAIQATPGDSRANWKLAECLRLENKTEEMKQQQARVNELSKMQTRMSEITTRELTARPNDARLHCELGEIILKQGYKDVGERWLLSALQRDPHLKEAHLALARLYKEQGNQEKAELHRQEAEASPDDDTSEKKPVTAGSSSEPPAEKGRK